MAKSNKIYFLSQFFYSAKLGLPFGTLFTGLDLTGKHCRRRKARTVFSDHQLTGLEKRFEAQRYLSTPERVELANALNLSETQVIFKPQFVQLKKYFLTKYKNSWVWLFR